MTKSEQKFVLIVIDATSTKSIMLKDSIVTTVKSSSTVNITKVNSSENKTRVQFWCWLSPLHSVTSVMQFRL